MKKGCLIALVVAVVTIFALVILEELISGIPLRRAKERIFQADHAVLLRDCRSLISNHSNFWNEQAFISAPATPTDLIGIKEGSVQFQRLPASVLSLRPMASLSVLTM